MGWREAVLGRLGTAVTKAASIKKRQLQEAALLKSQLVHPRWEVKDLALMQAGVTETAGRGTTAHGGSVPPGKPATLSPCPRSLSQLWTEWVKVVDSRLPAKDFSSAQRGDRGKTERASCL